MKPDNTARPRLKAPPGTCDTHMHIYDRRYPKAPTARIDAPDAPVSDYLKVRERLGMSEQAFPLARVLEGGTWAAGRRLARERRPDGGPPIPVLSDGTVF